MSETKDPAAWPPSWCQCEWETFGGPCVRAKCLCRHHAKYAPTDEPRLTEEELAEMERLEVHTPLQRQCVRLVAEVRRLRALVKRVVGDGDYDMETSEYEEGQTYCAFCRGEWAPGGSVDGHLKHKAECVWVALQAEAKP